MSLKLKKYSTALSRQTNLVRFAWNRMLLNHGCSRLESIHRKYSLFTLLCSWKPNTWENFPGPSLRKAVQSLVLIRSIAGKMLYPVFVRNAKLMLRSMKFINLRSTSHKKRARKMLMSNWLVLCGIC